MKNLNQNSMPEDTRCGDVAGGSLWTVGRLRAFVFERRLIKATKKNGLPRWMRSGQP